MLNVCKSRFLFTFSLLASETMPPTERSKPCDLFKRSRPRLVFTHGRSPSCLAFWALSLWGS